MTKVHVHVFRYSLTQTVLKEILLVDRTYIGYNISAVEMPLWLKIVWQKQSGFLCSHLSRR